MSEEGNPPADSMFSSKQYQNLIDEAEMSDTFTCYPIEKLLQWILAEEETGSIFGIQKDLFYEPGASDPFQIERYGQLLETPVGVAAGPHTQMSQNIISSWLTGARYIELKTVQVLDELEITKPCIKMEDEGYNCEWSQELKLQQSYDEYLNAWILLHVLKDRFGWGDPKSPGFIFNMSVGYNLEGIKSKEVQWFLDKLGDCQTEKEQKIKLLAKTYPRINEIEISDCISDNITVSTMHGCPPDEIEKIGRYFIEERKLHTAIKLNPTLLGPTELREILNHKLGFDTIVPDEAFEHDLKWEDGITIIENLKKAAELSGVQFGLKLTNTLETLNQKGNLPENEEMVYMSGRALHAISVNVARKIQSHFEGAIDLSFSAGVDCFNVAAILSCNMKPVTICSDLLKPGGYGRLPQYLEELEKTIRHQKADSIDAFICLKAGQKDLQKASLSNLNTYADQVTNDHRYRKSHFPYDNIKTARELPLFDCTQAPCLSTCPTEQDIPAYLGYTAVGKYEDALKVILDTNPFPNMQGKVCHHPCRTKCTRINLDNPLKIREIKRFVAEQQNNPELVIKRDKHSQKVGIIGSGPSGLSCAYFLALEGFSVEIFEAKPIAGGMAADAIPEFRLDRDSLNADIQRIKTLGVKIHLNSSVDQARFVAMREEFDFIYIAIGAQKSLQLGIPGEDSQGVIDQLDFLSRVRRGEKPELGKNVVVIGAGNSAMDAARTAKRLVEKNGEVTILYRRTQKEMPADLEEIEEALEEGIKIIELVAPEKVIAHEGIVHAIECSAMKLGDLDSSGRRRPVKIENSNHLFEVNTVIPAIGQKISLNFFPENELKVDPKTFETQLKNVFSGGDAIRGASTLIEAIADGRLAAENILNCSLDNVRGTAQFPREVLSLAEYHQKLARRSFGLTPVHQALEPLGFDLISQTLSEEEARQEADRCLSCDMYCSICTTVCPNRANIAIASKKVNLPLQTAKSIGSRVEIVDIGTLAVQEPFQIINIGDFCNECGNCTSFCPTNGSPYRTKPRFSLSHESFSKEENGFYLEDLTLLARHDGIQSQISLKDNLLTFESQEIIAVFDSETYRCKEVSFKTDVISTYQLKEAVIMGMLLNTFKDNFLFTLCC